VGCIQSRSGHAVGLVGMALLISLAAASCTPSPLTKSAVESRESSAPSTTATTPATSTPSAAPSGAPESVPAAAEAAIVEAIIDGDTLAIRGGTEGRVFTSTAQTTVRLLEVDTPETKHPSKPVECFGPQATTFLHKIAPVGSTVWAAPDVERTDRYGRDLLYLWNVDGAFVNLEIVRTGHGRAVLYEPNDRYITQMRVAEVQAKAAKRGLWGACSGTRATHWANPSAGSVPPGGGTDPRYGTCALAKAAGHGPYHAAKDAEYDWYRDADNDGIVCE